MHYSVSFTNSDPVIVPHPSSADPFRLPMAPAPPAESAAPSRQPAPTEAAAREALYRQFTPLVYRLIRQYGHDPELKQDLTGEIYCRFCALLDAFDPSRGVPLRPYLVRQLSLAVYTYARHHWRQKQRERGLQEPSGLGEEPASVDPTGGWVQALSQQQVASQLPSALSALPARQRRIVIWRYYEEKSFEEMALVLGVQPSTVRSLLRHGLNNLRKHIGAGECGSEES